MAVPRDAQDVINERARRYLGRNLTGAELQTQYDEARQRGETAEQFRTRVDTHFANVAPAPAAPGGGGEGGGEFPGFEFPDLSGLFANLGPSPQELALIEEQTAGLRSQRDLLQEQIRLQDIFAQFQVEQGGFQYIRDSKGKLIEIRPGAMATQRQALEQELLTQSLKASRGELPVSPTLARSFQDRDRLVAEALRRQLGPGYETSSPGIEALASERQFQTEATEAARRGELTLAQQLGISQAGQRLADTGAAANVIAPNLAVAAGLGNVAGGFGQAAATSIAGRQASLAGAAAQAQALLGQANLGANIWLGGQELGLRNRQLDLQRLLGLANLDLDNRKFGAQGDATQAARDAALWNAIAGGVGLLGGAAIGKWG